jgi:U3 small nucleolar RNA-associated protein 14
MQELDSDCAEEERMKMEKDRILERMTLRHKATGKWAKSMTHRSDEDGREALNEHFQRHEKLKKKIQGFSDSEDEQIAEDEAEYKGDDDANAEASFHLNKMEQEFTNESAPTDQFSGKGLFGMKFMQRALDQKKAEAMRMMEDLRKEIENEGVLSDDNEKGAGSIVLNNPGRRAFGTKLNTESKDDSDAEKGEKAALSFLMDENKRASDTRMTDNIEVTMPSNSKNPEGPKKSTNGTENSVSNPWLDANSSVKHTAEEPKVLPSVTKGEKEQDPQSISTVSAFEPEALGGDLEWNEGNDDEEDIPDPSNSKKIKFSQKELIARAFAGDDLIEEEFSAEKQAQVEEDMDKEEDLTLPGWGSWAGSSLKSKPRKKIIKKVPGIAQEKRQDSKLSKVIINEKESKRLSKYKVTSIPYPYQTREQYEKAIRVPLGKEWNSRNSFQSMSKPRAITRAGQIIHPITTKSKY